MTILSDRQIRWRLTLPAGDPRRLVIEPFVAERAKEPGSPSFGLQGFGYDIRLGRRFLMFSDVMTAPYCGPVEPHTFAELSRHREPFEADSCVIPARGFVLAESLERFEVPRDCAGQVFGKSTWARLGLCLNTTVLEPGWRGVITLELANLSPLPVLVRAGQGVGQVIFHAGSGPCATAYGDGPAGAGASYQGQAGLTLPRA